MIISDKRADSIMMLDSMLLRLRSCIEDLKAPCYECLFRSGTINKIDALFNQIYMDRAKENYRSAFRKCIFLICFIDREKRIVNED